MRKLYICMACLSILVLAGCLEQEEKAQVETPAVAVVTEAVTQGDFPQTVKVGGTLRGDFQSSILAKVTSTALEIPVRVGQLVKKNDILVKLDPGSVQSQYHQAEAVYQNASKQYSRMKSLFEAGAISQAQLDAAETEYLVAQASFENASQAVLIKAPFNGMVVDIPVRVGDEVTQGNKVVEIANVGALRLILDVPTTQVGQLRKGQIVKVASPLEDGTEMTGTVVSIADAANMDTRSFEVECRFENASRGFAPGVYVVALIQTNMLSDALLVSNDALMYRSGKTYLYSIGSDTVAMIAVEVLAEGDSMSAVQGQLTTAQRVVVVGQKNLTPGTKVREADK
ncbi:MAG: efflux RND transporter periplasmic adaptor subunit [Candidatus Zixiibacteriota bacterium]